eukprot:gene1136-1474_t
MQVEQSEEDKLWGAFTTLMHGCASARGGMGVDTGALMQRQQRQVNDNIIGAAPDGSPPAVMQLRLGKVDHRLV